MHSTDKATLRQEFSARRRALSDDEIAAARDAIRLTMVRVCAQAGWRCVAAYEPLRTEPGSAELLADLAALGVEVLVPSVRPDNDLDWSRWSADGSGGPLGVEAVGAADAVLVPALAVAFDGTRLGRGGGSYDRALARVAGVPTVALVYTDEVVETLPSDVWDRPVNAVVTPAGWRELS